jgi:hypothetical protein
MKASIQLKDMVVVSEGACGQDELRCGNNRLVMSVTNFYLLLHKVLKLYSMQQGPSWKANSRSASQEIPCLL